MELANILRLVNCRFNQSEKEMLRRIVINYTNSLQRELLNEDPQLAKNKLVSEFNFETRKNLKSCKVYKMTIQEGDIVYMDYGKAYLLEAGYQHFGIVVRMYNSKALVVPMTSNAEAYNNAYDELINPDGLTHLMKIGRQKGCYKYSVLFLNDAKFVNTARIINIKGHISTESALFKKIRARLVEIIQLGI